MLSEQIDAGARRVLEVFLETARKSLLGWFNEASVDFLQRPIFNASAALENTGRPLFGFQLGCALALYDVFMSLISHPEFFPELPLDPATVIHGPDRDDRFCDYAWITSTPPPAEQLFLPRRMTLDVSRYGLGDHLFEMAVRFLFYKEQMHYLLGHLGLANSLSRGFIWDEIAEPLPDVISPVLLRALELEADGHAAALLFQAGRDGAERAHAHLAGLGTALDWDRALLVAIGVIFMVVEWNDQRLAGAAAPTHASAAARTLHIFRLHAHIAGAEPRGDRGARIFVVQRVLGDLAVASELIGVLPMRPKDFLAGSAAGDETPAFREAENERAALYHLLPVVERFQEEAAAAVGCRALSLPAGEEPDWFEDRAWKAPVHYLNQVRFQA